MRYFSFLLRYWRIFTLFGIIMPVVCGSLAYIYIPKEGEPEVDIGACVVLTPYPGASPREIESLITRPLEEALDELDDVDSVRSNSMEGASLVFVRFEVDADIDLMLQRVKEAVTDAEEDIPDEAMDTVVQEIDFSKLPQMIISVSGDFGLARLKEIGEEIEDELNRLPHVLSTKITGGLTREIHVDVDPLLLDAYQLALTDVIEALRQSHISLPSGNVTIARQKLLVRPTSDIREVRQFNDVMVSNRQGRVVHARDIARVVDGFEEDRSFSRLAGQPSVSLSVRRRPGANILETSEVVRGTLAAMKAKLPPGIEIAITADTAKYISKDFQLMASSAFVGLILVIVVLYFFMGLRNAVITAMAIPLSMLFTFLLMFVFGLNNNNMTRFSMVLCIGMLVDNAIVVVENAYFHLQMGKDRRRAVIEGVSEIATPVIAATLTTISAFVPMLLMTGVIGKYMAFMPKVVTLALLSSLVVALVSNPILLARFLKLKRGQEAAVAGASAEEIVDQDLPRLRKLYERAVNFALNHRRGVLLSALGAFFLALLPFQLKGLRPGEFPPALRPCVQALQGSWLARLIEVEMFPQVDWDFIYIDVETPPGTEIEVTDRVVRRVEDIIGRHVPETLNLVANVGQKGESAYEISYGNTPQSNFAEVVVELIDSREFARPGHRAIMDRIRPYLEAIPGAKVTFRPIEWGPPKVAPVLVKIEGKEIPVLRRVAETVKEELEQVRGAVQVEDDFSGATPELRAFIDREKAFALGVSPRMLALTMRTALAGFEAVKYRDEMEDNEEFDVVVRLRKDARSSVEDLKRIKVRSASGALVPLGELLDFGLAEGVSTLHHEDLKRVVRVKAQNQDRSAVEITRELMDRMQDKAIPDGYLIDYSGDIEETTKSFRSLGIAYAVAFLLILIVLVAQFNSLVQPFAILTTLPLSFVGAMIGLIVTGNNFTIFGFVGLVGLSGIVVNDAIVLIDCINRQRQAGLDLREAILLAGKQRLRPIVSTTVTTIGGIITLTITDELWEGLGVVIIFGVAFATLLTLVFVPVFYHALEDLAANARAAFTLRLPAPRRGAGYSLVARRRPWLEYALVAPLQVLWLISGLRGTLGPMLVKHLATPVQAPSILKYLLEGITVHGAFLLQLLVVLLLYLSPTVLYVLWLRRAFAWEHGQVAVDAEGLHLSDCTGTTSLRWADIRSVRLERSRIRLLIRAGERNVRVGPMIEASRRGPVASFGEWVRRRPPGKAALQASAEALVEACGKHL